MASKFLTLQESVRDAADLYLSLKYAPPLFICDTPCGFVRHLDCRCKDVSEQLWGKYSGCFEIPKHGKTLTQVLLNIHLRLVDSALQITSIRHERKRILQSEVVETSHRFLEIDLIMPNYLERL